MGATRIHITGVGGQGTLLATNLIGQAALLAGIEVNISEVHGMAQRGGVVESAVILGSASSPIISGNEADILLGFEPSETLRAAGKCNSQSVVITNSRPQPPFTVFVGQGKYPDTDAALARLKNRVKKLVSLDAEEYAHQAGNILSVNMVMLGALAKNTQIGLDVKHFKQAIRQKTKKNFLDVNFKAFDLGYNN